MIVKISKKTFNDFHIALAFTVLFTAYNGQAHIQKTLTVSIHEDNPEYHADGFVNFGIIYTFFILSLWIAPPVIALMGCKISLTLGSLCYVSYVTFGYFENTWLTYAAGAMTGLGAALLWTSQATYCVLNSEVGSVYKSVSIFWIFCEASEFSGNFFVYCLFKDPNQPVDRSVRNKIAVVLGGFVLCSSLMLLCLRQPLRPQEKASKNSAVCSEIKKSLKVLVSKNMLHSSIIFMFCGLNLCFLNVLPASLGFSRYLSTNSKEYAPLSGVMHGSGEIIGTFLALYMQGKSVLKLRLIPITCIYTIIAYVIAYLGLPNSSVFTYTDEKPLVEMPIYVFLIANNFVGMADACLHIEAYNFIGNLYPVDCVAPFAVFKFIRNIAVASSSYYSNILSLHIQLGILISFSLASFIIYYWSWEACSSSRPKEGECDTENCVKELPRF